jgi:hypothetical protein
MDMSKAITNMLQFSMIDSLKDRQSLIYAGITFVVYIVFVIAMLYSMAGFIANLTGLNNSQDPTIILSTILGLYANMAIFIAPMVLILIGISYLMIGRALKASKRKYAPLTVVQYIKYLFLPLIGGLIAFLSLFNIKWLWLLVVGAAMILGGAIIAIVGGVIGWALTSIGVAVLLVYMIFVFYNSLRLYLADPIFVEGAGLLESMKKSWVLTKGNVWMIVLAILVLAIILMILSMVFAIPTIIYSVIFAITVGSSSTQPAGIGIMTNPGYIIAVLPSYLISAYSILVGNWFVVSMYNTLTKKK